MSKSFIIYGSMKIFKKLFSGFYCVFSGQCMEFEGKYMNFGI